MEFGFDETKSLANEAKHGLDFVQAQQLWRDDMVVDVPARTTDEPRFIVVAKNGPRHWSAIVTHRERRIRIISVRRSRVEEVALYEGE